MNQGEIIITYRVDSSGAITAMSNVQKKMHESERNLNSTQSKYGKFFDGLNQGFGGVANTIKKFGIVAAGVIGGGTFGAKQFIDLASGLQTTQAQMASLTGSTEAANKVFGQLYNQVLGKPIAFPDASKAASTLLGYGRTAQQVIPDMDTLGRLSIVSGANLQNLALVFGQVTSRGALFGQDALQLINNNIPLTTILAKKFGISMEEAAGRINGGKVSAEEFTAAMAEYAQSLDISKFSNTFQNRMISLQGSIRSLGLEIIGVRVDSEKGLIVDQNGLFARFSDGVTKLTAFLKENKQTIVDFANFIIDNAVPAIVALGSAFVAMKVGQFATTMAKSAIGLRGFIGALKSGQSTMAAFNAVAGLNPFTIIAVAIAAVVGALVFLQVKFNIFGQAWNAITAVWGAAAGWFGGVFEAIGQVISGFVSGVVGFFGGIWTGITTVFNNVVAFLQQWGLTILAVIFAPVALIIGLFFTFKDQIFAVFQAVWDFIVATFTPVVQFFGGIFTGAWNLIAGVWGAAIGWFGSIWGGIVGVFSVVAGWFGGVFRGAWNAIVSIFGGLAGWFRGIWNGIVGIFGSVGVSIGNAIGGAFRGAINGVLRFVSGMINGFINSINWAIGIINAIPGVNIPKLGTINIPQLAEGGIATKATLAMIGEGSEPEAVIPLSKLSQFLKNSMDERGAGKSSGDMPQINQTVNLTNGIDVDQYNRSLVQQMRRG